MTMAECESEKESMWVCVCMRIQLRCAYDWIFKQLLWKYRTIKLKKKNMMVRIFRLCIVYTNIIEFRVLILSILGWLSYSLHKFLFKTFSISSRITKVSHNETLKLQRSSVVRYTHLFTPPSTLFVWFFFQYEWHEIGIYSRKSNTTFRIVRYFDVI